MSILGRWSEEIIQKLDSVRSSKVAFILDPNPAVLSKHVSPYFSDLVPLAEQWQQIFRHALYFQQPLNCFVVDPVWLVTNTVTSFT